MNMMIWPRFLQEGSLKLVFFGGKGGVGKSTCATSAALKLAQTYPQHLFLLVSTDPAHSLMNIISNLIVPKNLEVRELNASVALSEFKLKNNSFFQEIAERGTFLDPDDIQGLMDSALPGMDELAGFLKIAEWAQEDSYYRIIIDTAPTGHTLRLLSMPELIHRWLIALDTLLAKHRYMRSHFSGYKHLDNLDVFLIGMNNSLKAIHTLMMDKERCNFILVMVAEAMIVEESIDLASTLSQQKVFMSDIIVNRLIPVSNCKACSAENSRQILALNKIIENLPKQTFWTLPMLAEEPRDKLLEIFWSELRLLDNNQFKTIPKNANNNLQLHIENPIQLPDKNLRLIIFAGKGGVGKTTLACATALRLQNDFPELRILLFSTDPAHSISDCLGMRVLSTPTQVFSKLDAQEINAEADFEKIRSDYKTELESFLQGALPNIDITFDREVLERLLDLAPTGLDEIMALTAIIDHLDNGNYDMIVLDSAPSGYLIRLLELPELIQNWLRMFFRLLLKYRKIIHFPHLSERLVTLSRELKSLRKLLQSSEKTGVYVVTIPSYLAINKTYDMISALQQLGVTIKALIINQMTSDSICNLCKAIESRESELLKIAQKKFPNLPMEFVYRQNAPVDLIELMAMGSRLYTKAI
jgi:arsenite-transporting ATPase